MTVARHPWHRMLPRRVAVPARAADRFVRDPGRVPGLGALRLALVAMLVIAIPAGAQTSVNRGIAVSRDVGVKIWIPAGSIRIVGWDRDSLHVEGTVGAGSSFFFGGAGNGAKFGIDDPGAGAPAPAARLTAWVPRGGTVSVRTVTASIDATDLAGWFSTVGGEIRLSGKAAQLQAEAIDGSISITASAPHVRARTGSGMLSVAGWAEDLTAATVSGPLTITADGLARARIESVTGAIVVAASVERASSIDIDSHSGSVELRLPANAGADFDLTSVAGSITNRFDKRMPVTSRQGRGQELSFATNPKGARIVVRTFKGPITLTRR